jgi:Alpha-tubulin suppressor and related RCC1 domain-containing proteins
MESGRSRLTGAAARPRLRGLDRLRRVAIRGAPSRGWPTAHFGLARSRDLRPAICRSSRRARRHARYRRRQRSGLHHRQLRRGALLGRQLRWRARQRRDDPEVDPGAISSLSGGVKAIAAGSFHACAVTAAGAAICWGHNAQGQLGNGTAIESSVPAPVAGLAAGVKAIAAGDEHTCALTTAGAVFAGETASRDSSATEPRD